MLHVPRYARVTTAEIQGNEVHPVETITRWAAESRGLLRHRCTVIQAQDRSTD
jgi:hypothetical protein